MRKPFSILNEQAANFSAVKASLEFSMIDWRYDMIDFAPPWDKQSILCLTNSRCYLLKETTYIEVKYLFEGCQKYSVMEFHILYCTGELIILSGLPFVFIGVYKPIGAYGGASTMAGTVYTWSHTLQLSSPGQPHSED